MRENSSLLWLGSYENVFYVDGIDLKDIDLEKEEGIQFSAQVEMMAFDESRVLLPCNNNEDRDVGQLGEWKKCFLIASLLLMK